MIRIRRTSGYPDRLRTCKIVLDGEVVGEIRRGQTLELDVPPGRHQMHSKIDWTRSNAIEFEADDETVEFECRSNFED